MNRDRSKHSDQSRRADTERAARRPSPASRSATGIVATPPDAVVVGSGFGGSVCAARLAEHGLRVLLLERGPWWGKPAAALGRAGRPYPRGPCGLRKAVRDLRWARGGRSRCVVLNRDGLLELHLFQRLIALTASGIGGGSLIYADIQMQPDDAFFGYFPAEISAEEMRPYYQRVRETLQPSPLPERPARTAVFEQAAASCGFSSAGPPDLAVSWPPPDVGAAARRASSYLLGCEYPGKRSLDRTYVPLALQAGAEVRPLSEVVALHRSGPGYRVRWVDHAGRRGYWVDAPIVVVAAGTLGTLRLLFAARDDRSLELPPALGRRFSMGGDVMTFIYRAPEAAESSYGPCPGAGVLVEQNGQHRLLIGEMGVPADSLPLPRRARRALRSSAALAGMGRDAAKGSMSFDGRELRTATDRSMGHVLRPAGVGHGRHRPGVPRPVGQPARGSRSRLAHDRAPFGGRVDCQRARGGRRRPHRPGIWQPWPVRGGRFALPPRAGPPPGDDDRRARRTASGTTQPVAATMAGEHPPRGARPAEISGNGGVTSVASQAPRKTTLPARSLLRGAVAGWAATVAMDLAARTIVAPALGMKPLGPDNLGRWIGHMREGQLTHNDIETAESVPHEAALGVATHYVIGPALGVGYGLVLSLAGREQRVLPLGTAYGIATTAFPWFIVYPAYGWGAMGLQGGGRKLAAFALLNHVVFGVDLGLAMTRARRPLNVPGARRR